MDFSWALSALKAGLKVTRKNWKQFLWLKPATTVPIQVCHDPVLKELAFMLGGSIPATETISACFQDEDGKWFIHTGWVPKPWDMFATDWEEYKMDAGKFGIVHCADTAERQRKAEAMLDDAKRKDAFLTELDKAAIDKLPKAGSMENCELLSNAINQLLDTVTCLPNLNAYVEPGPNNKELTITIREEKGPAADSVPVHVGCTFHITHHDIVGCHAINPDGITKSSIGGYGLNDKVEG